MISHQYDNLKQMSNDDGTIPHDKFTWWYLQEILINNRYYAEAKFKNNSKAKAEMYSVGSEITISSK